ncbi:MAG: hypothetical protein E7662_06450 [Ruminococcaceae bacterium]|nr:hypothetical protein [Oscillospiraceae bacterium]
MEFVSYKAFGAKGDGKTDDLAAIIAAHEYANEHHLPVKADEGAVYYIGDADAGAVIKTDTDWTGASFLLDDLAVNPTNGNRHVCIFNVHSYKEPYSLTGQITSVKKGQENLGITLPEPSLIALTDSTTRHYIRKGRNANKGSEKTDIVIVDRDGNVDMAAPVIWDFDPVTDVKVIPMDEEPLTLRGGTFTTIANCQKSGSGYYSRGIRICRANVSVEELTHYVTAEGEEGSAYSGILVARDCANLTVRNCLFTAHKTYYNNAKGLGVVAQGTYDISLGRSVNVTLENCRQTTDILDTAYWGLMGSNFCKNIVLKNCIISRFDAHQGVANVSIHGCTLGHQCLNAIGCGTLLVEDSTLYGTAFINLRSDYGSTWEGEAVIRGCTWIPARGKPLTRTYALISGNNSETHDFGYPCFMPHTVIIDGLHIDDSNTEEGGGICLLGNINPDRTDAEFEEKIAAEGYPYRVTEKIRIKNLTTASGRKWTRSANEFMFRHVTVEEQE